MQWGLMSDWESWGEIYTGRWRAAAFSSWPRPSGQLDERGAETRQRRAINERDRCKQTSDLDPEQRLNVTTEAAAAKG